MRSARSKALFYLNVLILVYVNQNYAIANNPQRARLLLDPGQSIEGLSWSPNQDTQEPLLQECKLGQPSTISRVCVQVKGKLNHLDWNLMVDSAPIKKDPDGSFKLTLNPPEGKTTEFTVLAISPLGTTQKQIIKIIMPPALKRGPSAKRFSISPGIGVNALTYQQEGFSGISQVALMVNISSSYLLSNRWELSGNVFYHVLPIQYTTGNNLRQLGGNLRISFRITPPTSRWSFWVGTGWSYTTSYSNNSDFGFVDFQGPVLYPNLQYLFPSGRAFELYLKYTSIIGGVFPVSLNSSDLGLGGAFYFVRLRNGQSIGVTFDISHLALQLSDGAVQSTSYSGGFSYKF